MKSLVRQTAAFVIALLAALLVLGGVTAFTQAALARSSSVPAARIPELAASLLLPSVLVALLIGGLYARARGSSLAMAVLALAALAAGREVLGRRPAEPAAAAVRLETLVAPREFQPLANPGAWLYAGEVSAERLRDVLVIAAAPSASGRPETPRLAYVAQTRPGPDLRIGAWRLKPQPVRLALLAADEEIRSIGADLSALERRTRGASRGGEPALTLAGVLLAFAATGVIVRRSRWPLLGWCAALLVARGALFALGPQGEALAARALGSAAAMAPAAAVTAAALVLAAADLLAGETRPLPRGARRG